MMRRKHRLRDLWWDFLDFAEETGIWLLAVALVLAFVAVLGAGLVWGGATYDRRSCHEWGRNVGVQTRYDFPSGCYVREEDGTLIDSEVWVRREGNKP